MFVEQFAPWLVALNLVAIVLLLVFTRIRPWKIFIASSCVLYMTGLLPLDKTLAGFSNPSLLVLVLLFFVSMPLERTALVRRLVAAIVNGSVRSSTLKLGVLGALVSSIVNNTAVVAALLGPLKKQQKIAPSRLLLPLSYASIIGGTLTLIGTSTNLIVNGFVQQAGYPPLDFFAFSMIALPVVLCCLLVMVVIAPWALPKREIQLNRVTQEYFLEREVVPGSALIGRSLQENGLRRLEKIFLVEVIRGERVVAPVSPEFVVQAGDVLVFTGDVSAIDLLDEFDGLESPEAFNWTVRDNVREVIVSPTANVVGRTIKAVDFRAKFDAAVVAVRRGNERLQGGLGQLVLKAGDALVLATGPAFQRHNKASSDFIPVGGVDVSRLLSRREELAVYAGFGLIVALGATGFVPLLKGLIVLVALLLALRILTVDDIKARFPYELVIVITGALALSQAVFDSGLSDLIGDFAGEYLGGYGVVGALIGLFLLTWILTELVTNNAAAAIIFPLAMAMSSQWGGDYMPFVMAVAFGASASFLSPYGYQTNLMVYSAGNYRVVDYVRFGLPVLLVYCTVSLLMIVGHYGL
ncbi:MAG: SLC13 family permease [Candidatus Pelagadaptatus aseana]|uniref:SLC13 family permease n=1 Tax=Candidatus Pelagadaptatus aseana TaxID=3120508 RepID=UPI0039B28516